MVAVEVSTGLERRGVGADIGLGQREGHDQLAAGDLGQVFALLRGRAVHQDALRADADIGAEHRAERRRGAAKLIVDLDFLAYGKADAAEFLGNGQAEQAHGLHVFNDVGGHIVGFFQYVFGGNQMFLDETLDGGELEFKGFGIEGHDLI